MKGLAIGSERFITFFRLLGFVGLESEDKNEVLNQIKSKISSYGLIVIDRSVVKGIEKEIDELSMKVEPPILVLDPPYRVFETATSVESEVKRVMKVF
ncbi:MAG: V-type ATP synthase subunit F [Nitrososphaeria archaeon]